jgi:D-alanyl-D-alanine dipeptidase
LGATGEIDAATLQAMKGEWQAQRPFVALRARGVCPEPPAAGALAEVASAESYGGRPLQLRRRALLAYRRMIRFGRRSQPALRARPELLQVFSAYRDPERDAARCAAEGNCQGVVRAACSAHRTGLALDLVLDTAPGFAVDSSADANRLAMARGFAYRWLLAEAPRYGFVNYAFEPWHWEWTGERP